jgi:transposase, IS5 family
VSPGTATDHHGSRVQGPQCLAGQKRRLSAAIKRAFQCRSAIEPAIGHLKAEHRMGRNYLIGSHGDAITAVLGAVGYTFRLLLAWLALWLSAILAVLAAPPSRSSQPQRARSAFFTDD